MWLELWTPLDPGVMDTCSCPQSSFFNLIHFCHYSYLLLWPVLFPIGIIFMGKISFYWKKFQVLLLNPKTSPQMKSELKNLICKTFNKLASLFFLLTMPSRSVSFYLSWSILLFTHCSSKLVSFSGFTLKYTFCQKPSWMSHGNNPVNIDVYSWTFDFIPSLHLFSMSCFQIQYWLIKN
jgi:hypothetical protein